MKKIFGIMFAVMLVFGVAGMSMACDGPDCYGSGNFDGSAAAGSVGIDAGLKIIPNGMAYGLSGYAGGSVGVADGWVINGAVEGDPLVWGGGLTNTDTYVFTPQHGDIGIGVGSSSSSQAVTGGYGEIGVDVGGKWYQPGLGYASMTLFGVAVQGTHNASMVGSSPLHAWDSNGLTGGSATQGSIGAWGGNANVGAVGWGSAEAGMKAEINMWGGSYSESYRFIDWNDDAKTEGMGTNVGAYTNVTSYEDSWRNRSCLASANTNVSGGFVAGGNVHSATVQTQGLGGGMATANGSYTGAGSLGCNYTGSAVGGTYTSITTVQGMNGSIVNAGASMRVESRIGSGSNPQ